MKNFRVTYSVATRDQWEGREPWGTANYDDSEIAETETAEEAIGCVIDFLIECIIDNGEYGGYPEISEYDGETIILVYDCETENPDRELQYVYWNFSAEIDNEN